MTREVNTAERALISDEQCPHCKTKTLLCGPQGGWCMNLTCSTCNIKLNLGLFAPLDKTYMAMEHEPIGYVKPEVPLPPAVRWWQVWRRKFKESRA